MTKPNRNIRIDDRLWMLAQQKAKREFTTVTAYINRCLYEWVRQDYPAQRTDEAQPDKE